MTEAGKGEFEGHTPGPWRVHDADGSIGTVNDARGHMVAQAQMVGGTLRPNHEERRANARLIAASPDLLRRALAAEVERDRCQMQAMRLDAALRDLIEHEHTRITNSPAFARLSIRDCLDKLDYARSALSSTPASTQKDEGRVKKLEAALTGVVKAWQQNVSVGEFAHVVLKARSALSPSDDAKE